MNIKSLTIFAISSVLALSAFAQVESSPYSMYGYGILSDNASAAQRQMGGVGYGMNSSRNINVMNPASYAAIDSLTFLFDMGVDFSSIISKENGVSETRYGGGLEYITMQFPLSNRFGMSIGLLPYSSIGYSFGTSVADGALAMTGTGGLNQAYVGFSSKIFKGLSLGINASYLFGSNLSEIYATTDDGEMSAYERLMQVRDFHIQLGAQYTVPIDKKSSLTLGVVYSPKKTLLGHTWSLKARMNSEGTKEKIDTLSDISLRNNYELPHTFGVGLAYNFDKRLSAGLDFTFQKWSDVKYTEIELGDFQSFADRWKIAGGFEYQPTLRGSWLKRITYRAGLFYNRDYITIDNDNVKDYGFAFGFGIPTSGGKSIINLGLEYRHRDAGSKYLSENFFNVMLGFKINEMWFWKNKIR